MAKVEVLYPFGGAKRGDVVDVPDDKVPALRRLHWAQEVKEPPARAKSRRVKVEEKEPDVDERISKEAEAGSAD